MKSWPVCSFTVAASLLVALTAPAAMEGDPTITILSPRTGDKVATTFDLSYEIVNAPHGNHAHVYLDGTYQKGFKGTFRGVTKGDHQITVRIADHDHKDDGTASATVTVTVE
jgi:hypothetical protein